jgi:hypothetical protein
MNKPQKIISYVPSECDHQFLLVLQKIIKSGPHDPFEKVSIAIKKLCEKNYFNSNTIELMADMFVNEYFTYDMFFEFLDEFLEVTIEYDYIDLINQYMIQICKEKIEMNMMKVI